MTWVFVIFLNGWKINIEAFDSYTTCEDKVILYRHYLKKNRMPGGAWCEALVRA